MMWTSRCHGVAVNRYIIYSKPRNSLFNAIWLITWDCDGRLQKLIRIGDVSFFCSLRKIVDWGFYHVSDLVGFSKSLYEEIEEIR